MVTCAKIHMYIYMRVVPAFQEARQTRNSKIYSHSVDFCTTGLGVRLWGAVAPSYRASRVANYLPNGFKRIGKSFTWWFLNWETYFQKIRDTYFQKIYLKNVKIYLEGYNRKPGWLSYSCWRLAVRAEDLRYLLYANSARPYGWDAGLSGCRLGFPRYLLVFLACFVSQSHRQETPSNCHGL